MRAVEISTPGSPDVLKLVERPDPTPGAGGVLIRVAAAGVNRPDILQRKGAYPPPPGASDLPGLEVAGTIEALGSGVTEWRAGDRVCALLAGGGYATLCTAPAVQCLPIPKAMDFTSAAALPRSAIRSDPAPTRTDTSVCAVGNSPSLLQMRVVSRCVASSMAKCQARIPGPAIRSPTTSGVCTTTENMGQHFTA
jgi:hypothetical protein